MNLKSLTLCAALVASTLALLAPAVVAGPLPEWGLKGGLSVANMQGGLEGSDNLLSFGAGAYLNFPLPFGLGIQPEVLYVVKGVSYGETSGRDEAGNFTGTSEVLVAIDYIEVPVLLRWSLPTPGIVHPSLLLGPAFSIRARSRLKVSGNNSRAGDVDWIKDADVGVAFGGGASVGAGRRRVNAEARYTIGLANVVDPAIAGRGTNRDFLVMLGMGF